MTKNVTDVCSNTLSVSMKTQENTAQVSQSASSPLISSDRGNDKTLPFQCQDNHTPLRLNGGGDTSFENQERFNPEHQGNVMKTSLSEQDIRDVLSEAGYTIEIDNVLAANIVAGLNDLSNTTICAKSDVSGNCYNSMLPAGINDLSNSTVSVESDISSTGFIRGSDLTDQSINQSIKYLFL